VALFLSFSPFILLFSLLLASRSDGTESPSLPPSSPTFHFTSSSSNLGLFGSDLLEALGDSSLQRILSLLSAHPCLSSGFRDLLWLWLFGGQPVWGSPPVRVSVRVSLDYSTFEVDSSKPLFEGPLPHLNRMAPLAKATSIQLLRGLLGWDLDSKLAAVPDNNCCGCSYYLLDCRQNLCRRVFLLLLLLMLFVFVFVLLCMLMLLCYCFPSLAVGLLSVTNVTSSSLFVGFYLPLRRVV
jgi:hypothetical protein